MAAMAKMKIKHQLAAVKMAAARHRQRGGRNWRSIQLGEEGIIGIYQLAAGNISGEIGVKNGSAASRIVSKGRNRKMAAKASK
jgi:hypothetical protein